MRIHPWLAVVLGGCAGSATTPSTTTGVTTGASIRHGTSVLDGGPLGYDWVGIVGNGQSLSVGVAGLPPISVTQAFGNLKLVDQGPDPKYPLSGNAFTGGDFALVPLVEPIRPTLAGTGPGYTDSQYPNDIIGETPHSALATQLSTFAQKDNLAFKTVHSVVGFNGSPLSGIDKEGGQRAYPAGLAEAAVFNALAADAGARFGYGAIVLTHGESDQANLQYAAGLFQLWQDYNQDLPAITGQTTPIPVILSQQNTFGPPSMVEQLQACDAHPGQLVCSGPKYQYAYEPARIHLYAIGYDRVGQKYAEALYTLGQGQAWKPLEPTSATRAGSVVTVSFAVPFPPLRWNPWLGPNHASDATGWQNGNGFELTDAAGNKLPIAHVTLTGETVQLDTGTAFDGGVTVAYAYTPDPSQSLLGQSPEYRGQLRDSDPFVPFDAQTAAATVHNGSTTAVLASSAATWIDLQDAVSDSGGKLPAGTVVTAVNGTLVTLSQPWSGPTGSAQLSFAHDSANYCMAFQLAVP